MRVAEIFHSIQGEGELAGMPSVFIRTSGCNLRCAWCDTPYASWSPEGGVMTVESVIDAVARYPARHCVLTGGEPMVAAGIHDLARALGARGYHITIETAATLPPGGIACDLASLSPKLANSTPGEAAAGAGWARRHDELRLRPDVIRAWCADYPVQLKFVVRSEGDLPSILELWREAAPDVPPGRILLMPEATEAARLDALSPAILRLCLAHGFRYCDRLHIRLFGNTRGT